MSTRITLTSLSPFEPLGTGSQLQTNLKKQRLIDYFITLLEVEADHLMQQHPKDRTDHLWDVVRAPTSLHIYGALFVCTICSALLGNGTFMAFFAIINWIGFVVVAFLFLVLPLLSGRPALRPSWAQKQHLLRPHTKTLLNQSFLNIANNDPNDAQKIAYLNVSNAEDLYFSLQMLRALYKNYQTSK